MENSVFVEALFLIKNGVTPDLAFSMKPAFRRAAVIVYGQMNGGKFDFDAWRWQERD